MRTGKKFEMHKKCHLFGREIVLDRKCCIDDGGFVYKTFPTIIIRISKFTLYVLWYQVSRKRGNMFQITREKKILPIAS